MAVNQVIFGNQIVIDITDSTVNPNTLLAGYKAYGANGEQVTGNVELSYHITLHKAQYDQLSEQEKLADENFFYIDDINLISAEIDDNTYDENKVWSSLKLKNMNKTSVFEVSDLNWVPDVTSQSGVTLQKQTVNLNHVYNDVPEVDIAAASGNVLPTTDEQTAYDLVQYITVDSAVPCLYLYASEVPADPFYIKVKGVD